MTTQGKKLAEIGICGTRSIHVLGDHKSHDDDWYLMMFTMGSRAKYGIISVFLGRYLQEVENHFVRDGLSC